MIPTKMGSIMEMRRINLFKYAIFYKLKKISKNN